METHFAELEALVASMASSMVAHVKSNVFVSRMPSDQGNMSSLSSNLIIFYGAEFSRPLAPNDDILKISRDHVSEAVNDGNLIKFSITTLMTKVKCICVGTMGIDERLDPQHGEA
jgi:hypothetical protein